jgi:hypothetical protein
MGCIGGRGASSLLLRLQEEAAEQIKAQREGGGCLPTKEAEALLSLSLSLSLSL